MRGAPKTLVILYVFLLSGMFVVADSPVRGWRGDWTGRFLDAKPVTAWNVERGLNVLWRVPLKQFSNAQPVISGDRVYTLAEGRSIICLDKMTGKLLWVNKGEDKATTDPVAMRAVVEENLLPGVPSTTTNSPSFVPWSRRKLSYGQNAGNSIPTPVTDGKYIWTKSGGGASCYDLDGNRVWVADTHLAGTDHPMNVPSPVLIGNVLVCEGGSTPYWMENSKNKMPDGTFPPNPNKGFKHWVVGLEANTGKLLWDIGPVNAGGYGGPASPVALVLTNGSEQVAFVLTGEGHLIRSADGKLIIPYVGGRSGFASPVVLPGQRVLFGTRAMVQFVLKSPDQVSATLAWAARDFAGAGGAAVSDGGIYTINAGGDIRIHALEEATGRYLGCTVLPVTPPPESPDWPSCASAGKYLFMFAGRQVYVLESGSTPRLLAANDTDRTYSGPIFDGERLYLRSFDALTCIALKGEEGARYEREVQAKALLLPFPATLGRRRLLDPAPMSKDEKPGAGVPVVKFELAKMPANWLIAGPFPGTGTGAPAALVTPEARPAKGTNVTVGDTTKPFASPERGIVSANGLDVVKATAGTNDVHLFAYTLLDVSTNGYFRFVVDQPCVQVWMSGQALDGESAVKLTVGRYAMLLKATVKADTASPTTVPVKVYFREASDPVGEETRNLTYVRDNAPVLQRVKDLVPGSAEAVHATALLQAVR